VLGFVSQPSTPKGEVHNVVGTQIGIALILILVSVGLASVAARMSWWLDWLRLAGAAYLAWLGVRLLRSATTPAGIARAPVPRGGFLLQGLLVALSNPKVLLFFGAVIPQFLDPAVPPLPRLMLLGLTAMGLGIITDGAYVVLAGSAKHLLSTRRQRLVAGVSGTCLLGGGLWLALARAR
jgi:homoserine/homoserine lactone efflux protein